MTPKVVQAIALCYGVVCAYFEDGAIREYDVRPLIRPNTVFCAFDGRSGIYQVPYSLKRHRSLGPVRTAQPDGLHRHCARKRVCRQSGERSAGRGKSRS